MGNVRPISYDVFEKLGVDENNNLYWDAKPVVTRRKVSLPVWVNVAAVAASVSTVAMAVTQVWDFVERHWFLPA